MAITRADLRNKIKNKLSDRYKDQTTVSVYLSAAATTGYINSTTAVRSGDLIEIGDEVLQVTSVNNSGLLFNRGYQGTTAADHSASTPAYVLNLFSNAQYNDAITEGFNSLYLQIGIPYTKDIHDYNNRYQLDSLDAVTGWSGLADANQPTLNTTNQIEGAGCLNLGFTFSSGTGAYTKTTTSTMDCSNYEYLNLWIYLSGKINTNNTTYFYNPNQFAEIRYGNSISTYNYIRVGLDQLMDSGWSLLNLNLQDFSASGTVDTAAIDYLAIYIKDQQNVTIGNIQMDEWFFSTYPLTNSAFKKRLPRYMNNVHEVRIFASENSTDYVREARYELDDNYITFKRSSRNNVAGNSIWPFVQNSYGSYTNTGLWWFNQLPQGLPIQLMGFTFPSAPTSDSSTIELESQHEELIILYATNYLIESLMSQRALTTQLSSQLNRQGGSVLDWLRIGQQTQTRYRLLLSQMEQPGKPVEFDMSD